MKRAAVLIAKILGIIVAVLAVLLLTLQLVLNSSWMRSKVDSIAASAIENGQLRYSRLHFRTFPILVAEVDSLSLTYPHGLFSKYDRLGVRGPLLKEGRGAVEDTLMSAARISAGINPWKIFCGRIRVNRLHIDRPRVFYHAYDGTASNLDIFAESDAPADTASTPSGLPWISLGDVRISDRPRIVYTSQADTVHASICFDELLLRWDVHIKKDRLASKLRHGLLQLDSLKLSGRLPADTLSLTLDRLCIRNPRTNVLDLGLDGDLLYFSPSLGSLHVPAAVEALAGFNRHSEGFDIRLDRFDGSVAYIPLHADGLFSLCDDHNYIDARAAIDSCNLATVLDEYATHFAPGLRGLHAHGALDLDAEAKGRLSEKEKPKVDASLLLHLRSDGVKLGIDGDGRDLIGRNPVVAARLSGFALLDSLRRYLGSDSDISASGRVNLSADVNAHLNELDDYHFRKSHISCSLDGNRLSVRMPSQGLLAVMSSPDIKLVSGEDALHLSANLDSIGVKLSDDLRIGLSGMVNRADISKELRDSSKVPVMRLSTDNRYLKVYAGDSKIEAENALVSLEAYQRTRRVRPQRRRYLDSLQRAYPGVPRDSLFARARRDRPKDEFASKDIRVALDSSLLAMWYRWHPGGLISLENASLVSPSLPLRTRLNSLDLALDDEDAQIASCSLDCGTSDMSLTGSLGGMRRFARGRGPLRFKIGVESDRINLNEILVAMQQGAPDGDVETGDFVADSLENAVYDPSSGSMKAIVVPRNLRGSIGLLARRVDYSNFVIRPASAEINIRDRVLQVKDVDVQTDLGRIGMDAFYSTKSRSDISAGLDMHLKDMSAYDIIHTLPTVDAMMPALKSFEGKLACDLSATTQLDTNMNVLTPTLNGLVRISGQDLYVKNAGSLRKITRLLMFKDKNIGHIEDMYVDAVVKDNKVEVYPFVIGVDRYRVALSGVQGFNGSMRYNASIIKSFLPFNFGINIYGNLDKWRFSLGRSKYRSGRVPSFTTELDTMQINLLSVIRGVYDRGVDRAMEQAAIDGRRLEQAKMLNSYTGAGSDEMLSKEEFQEVDSLLFEMQMQEESEQVDALLEETADKALAALSAEQMKWLAEHPWADAAMTRAEQRKAERAKRKEEKEN